MLERRWKIITVGFRAAGVVTYFMENLMKKTSGTSNKPSTLSFGHIRVLIVGDVMLDRYFFGEVNRISPEAPVPIVKVNRMTSTLGGAANVASNVAGLGARAVLIGVAGRDEAREHIEKHAREQGIVAALVAGRLPTITKTRVIGAHQQMLRLDLEEPIDHHEALIRDGLRRKIAQYLRRCDIVVMSDYGKGVCSEQICRGVIAGARKARIPVIVDPKTPDWKRYSHATYISPNVKELSLAVGAAVPNEDGPVVHHARSLIARFHIPSLLVTRSEKGISLVTASSVRHIHSRALAVFDVSGAGDTVVATFAVASAAGFPCEKALTIANAAAGIVVAKVGTCPIELVELEQACIDDLRD
jgi:D-beta-D-heptose 7-phosphate kinase/D-beta-D-heptose 1-phosphate adenosyltransferase